jgi:hypothetical protein
MSLELISSTNGVGKTVYPYVEDYLSLCTKKNSNWINDLNIRPETLKFLEENT